MTRLLLATRNRDKVKEIAQALTGLPVELVPAEKWGNLPDIEEDHDTLIGNAVKKAVTLARITNIPTLADDTGLEVDALNGAPGVHSSRYSGERATYDENVDKLLHEMRNVPDDKRGARFRCVIALAVGDQVETVEGVCEGTIARERHGNGGFGYDPVFIVHGLDKSFAELTLEEKNKISHRGVALQKARLVLAQKFSKNG